MHVKINQNVKKGDCIGAVGVTGAEFLLSRPNEIHLHFEVFEKWWPDGFADRKNPEHYINILKAKN
ncbi:peptidoglycan DD-metalloendopeptidase family protein [Tenuifilum thalassicum]|uniref:Peptidoglycan DD-metalloendopeptidase family protein n=1 Tax=Tenuifilum thalassicum TaxID=2590900 RepID=A0A7D4CIJ7_9BACT|nr:peptidoglycan DD-metalloendopeptidase family protein [Tenuifilum thalassicum]